MDSSDTPKMAETFSNLGKALDSMDKNYVLKRIAGDSVNDIIKGLGDMKVFSTASTLLGSAGALLQFGIAIAGVQSPEEKIIGMIDSLSNQVKKFQSDVNLQFEQVLSKIDTTNALQPLREAFAVIEAGQENVAGYWRSIQESGTPANVKRIQRMDKTVNLDKIREQIEAALWGKGPLGKPILDLVYKESQGDRGAVAGAGMWLLHHAAALPCLEATRWRARIPKDRDPLEDLHKYVLPKYDQLIEDIVKKTDEMTRKCLNDNNVYNNCKKKVDILLKDQKKNLKESKAAYFKRAANELVGKLAAAYPSFDWSVAAYKGVMGHDKHCSQIYPKEGSRGHKREMTDPIGRSFERFRTKVTGYNGTVNFVVCGISKSVDKFPKKPDLGPTLKKMRPRCREVGSDNWGYSTLCTPHVDYVWKYVRKFKNYVCFVHLVKSDNTNVAFAMTDASRTSTYRDSEFTGFVFA